MGVLAHAFHLFKLWKKDFEEATLGAILVSRLLSNEFLCLCIGDSCGGGILFFELSVLPATTTLRECVWRESNPGYFFGRNIYRFPLNMPHAGIITLLFQKRTIRINWLILFLIVQNGQIVRCTFLKNCSSKQDEWVTEVKPVAMNTCIGKSSVEYNTKENMCIMFLSFIPTE